MNTLIGGNEKEDADLAINFVQFAGAYFVVGGNFDKV